MSDTKNTHIGSGQTLFRQGEKGGDLFFIKSGEVELTVRNEETGETAVVATLGPQSVLGTMSFLEGDKRSATAIAKTDIDVVKVNHAQRDKMLQTVPAWLKVLIKDLSQNLRRQNDEFAHLTAQNALLEKKLAASKAKEGDESEEES